MARNGYVKMLLKSESLLNDMAVGRLLAGLQTHSIQRILSQREGMKSILHAKENLEIGNV